LSWVDLRRITKDEPMDQDSNPELCVSGEAILNTQLQCSIMQEAKDGWQ